MVKNLFDPCIYFNISVLNRMLSKQWKEVFEKYDLITTEAYILFALWEDPEITQKYLADTFSFNQSTTSRHIESLVSKKMVNKVGRGKGSSISISTKGSKAAKEISESMDELYQKMSELLGGKEFKSITKKLTQARKILEEENDE